MSPWLYLLFLFIISDMIASGVTGFVLWWRRNGGIKVLAIVFTAMFIRGLCELFANACGYERRPVYTIGFAVFFWTGRACWTAAIWWFLAYLLSRPARYDQAKSEPS